MEENLFLYLIITCLVTIILLVIPALIWGNGDSSIAGFKKQLDKCRYKIPNWNLKYECEVLSDNFEDNLYFVTKTEYYDLEFTNYELYKQAKERFNKKEFKNCEVRE